VISYRGKIVSHVQNHHLVSNRFLACSTVPKTIEARYDRSAKGGNGVWAEQEL
jgi:hypothetical protein